MPFTTSASVARPLRRMTARTMTTPSRPRAHASGVGTPFAVAGVLLLLALPLTVGLTAGDSKR